MDLVRRPRAWPAPALNVFRGVRGTDILLAAGLALAFSEPGFDPYHHDSGAVWAAIGVLGTTALAWRRVAPQRVWLITTVTTGWLLVMRHGQDWGGLSPLVLIPTVLVALGTIASQSSRHIGLLAMAVSATALEASLLSHNTRPEAVAMIAALVCCAWAVGEGARARASALDAERSERDLRAAADERARIARELHDIVAHHVSVISLQAGTARLLAESGAAPDAALLAGIETASRQAMTELRHALGVIRHTPGGAEPLPGLARLRELATGSGLAVTIDGDAGPLPTALDLTAYRIVQESLTNVLRHSAARAARVTLRQQRGALRITVTDDGPAHAKQPRTRHLRIRQEGGGQGLAGLRERVTVHGGTFRAGPQAVDPHDAYPQVTGFEVHAELPIQGLSE